MKKKDPPKEPGKIIAESVVKRLIDGELIDGKTLTVLVSSEKDRSLYFHIAVQRFLFNAGAQAWVTNGPDPNGPRVKVGRIWVKLEWPASGAPAQEADKKNVDFVDASILVVPPVFIGVAKVTGQCWKPSAGPISADTGV